MRQRTVLTPPRVRSTAYLFFASAPSAVGGDGGLIAAVERMLHVPVLRDILGDTGLPSALLVLLQELARPPLPLHEAQQGTRVSADADAKVVEFERRSHPLVWDLKALSPLTSHAPDAGRQSTVWVRCFRVPRRSGGRGAGTDYTKPLALAWLFVAHALLPLVRRASSCAAPRPDAGRRSQLRH